MDAALLARADAARTSLLDDVSPPEDAACGEDSAERLITTLIDEGRVFMTART